jgi:hypothetical protein
MAWIGPLIQGVGMIAEGQMEQKAAGEQAVSLTQQKVREGAAALEEEKDFRAREKRLLATGRVARAVSGITEEGSPLLVASDLAGEIEEEAMKIRHGGELRQRRMGQQADLSLRQGRRAMGAALVRGGGSLLKSGYMYGRNRGGGTV